MGFWRAAETLLHAPCPSLRAHGPGVNRSPGGTKWLACPCRGALQYRPFGVAIRAVRQCNTGCFATQNGPYCNALSASVLVVLCSVVSCRVLPEGMVNRGRGGRVASMWPQPAHAASHGRRRWLPPAPWPTGRLRRGRRPGLHFYSVQWLLFAIFFVILQAHSGT